MSWTKSVAIQELTKAIEQHRRSGRNRAANTLELVLPRIEREKEAIKGINREFHRYCSQLEQAAISPGAATEDLGYTVRTLRGILYELENQV